MWSALLKFFASRPFSFFSPFLTVTLTADFTPLSVFSFFSLNVSFYGRQMPLLQVSLVQTQDWEAFNSKQCEAHTYTPNDKHKPTSKKFEPKVISELQQKVHEINSCHLL